MYMRTICFCLVLIARTNMCAQEFKERHIKKLEKEGKTVYKAAYTHQAKKLLGGQTLHNLFGVDINETTL